MRHDWWLRRSEEREASQRLWAEFERTRPLSDPELTEKETEVTREKREPTPVPPSAEQHEQVGGVGASARQPARRSTPRVARSAS